MAGKLQVDIWSDVVCPWCAIGKRRLDVALAKFVHAGEVEVVWHSFEPKGLQSAVKERFFPGYMTEAEAIGDREALVRLASEAGLDADEVRAVLGSDQFAREVRADEQAARARHPGCSVLRLRRQIRRVGRAVFRGAPPGARPHVGERRRACSVARRKEGSAGAGAAKIGPPPTRP
jgi:hypothetical protein